MKSVNDDKLLLFCPGPVNVAENVKAAVASLDICHREKEFEQVMRRLKKNALKVLEVKHPEKYAAVFVTGSGTAGNETIISSLGKNKRILVLTNGEFGERLFQITQIHHNHVKQLSFGWANSMDLTVVKKYVANHKVDAIIMVHHETSTGMLNPIKEIGQIAYDKGAQFMVDAVSSATAEKIDIEGSHITFLNTTSGKAMAAYPGIATIIGKKEAFESLAEHQPKTAYLNLYKFYHYASLNQTPNTPGVQLFFALDQAIQNILNEGIDKRQKRTRDLASHMRQGMENMNLSFLLTHSMSSTVTSVLLPKKMKFSTLQKALRKKNIIIYNGKGPFKDKIFQVGHMGELTLQNADYFLECLQDILTPIKKQTKKTQLAYKYSIAFPSHPKTSSLH